MEKCLHKNGSWSMWPINMEIQDGEDIQKTL